MKSLICLLILVIGLPSLHAEKFTGEEKEIVTVLKKSITAYHTGDFESYSRTWAHEPFVLRQSTFGDKYSGWDKLGPQYKQILSNQNWEDLEFDLTDLQIHVNGNSAWAVHGQPTKGIVNGKSTEYNNWSLRFLDKIDGQWKITYMYTGMFIPNKRSEFEGLFNMLGYALLQIENTDEAISAFELNTKLFPNSSNAYDSLGEAFMIAGDNEGAIKNYEKSLQLDPNNENAEKMLKKIKSNQ